MLLQYKELKAVLWHSSACSTPSFSLSIQADADVVELWNVLGGLILHAIHHLSYYHNQMYLPCMSALKCPLQNTHHLFPSRQRCWQQAWETVSELSRPVRILTLSPLPLPPLSPAHSSLLFLPSLTLPAVRLLKRHLGFSWHTTSLCENVKNSPVQFPYPAFLYSCMVILPHTEHLTQQPSSKQGLI